MQQKLTEIKGKTDNSTVLIGDFNITLSIMDKARQNINKQTNKKLEELNNIVNQPDLTYIYRTLCSTTAEFTFFSSQHGIFFRMESILSYKINLNKFLKIEIIKIIISNQNGIKLLISQIEIWEPHNYVKIKSILLHNQWIKEVIKIEITNFFGGEGVDCLSRD